MLAAMPGTLFVVATPIGNLEDITLRALRVLREVAVIAAEDTRRTAQLLARHGIATPTTSLHEHNERQKSASLIARLARGEHIALVSDAGTPTVSDPGGHFIRHALEAGIRVEPIPGASAVLAVLSASGLPTERFTFLGFPPTRSKDRKKWLADLTNARGTAVFFEAPHRIRRTLDEVAAAIGNCEVVIGRELTKVHEQLVKGPIKLVASTITDPKGEFTVALFVGQKPDYIDVEGMHASGSRRMQLASLAKSYGVTANELYAALQSLKNIGE
jgi:16S rRNA (cytidine1402-2'-O)-methyltransferase